MELCADKGLVAKHLVDVLGVREVVCVCTGASLLGEVGASSTTGLLLLELANDL